MSISSLTASRLFTICSSAAEKWDFFSMSRTGVDLGFKIAAVLIFVIVHGQRWGQGLPLNRNETLDDSEKLERFLERFLGDLYDRLYAKGDAKEDIYEQMQGDQPNNNNNENNINSADFSKILENFTDTNFNNNNARNVTDVDYFRTLRNRTKENWIQALKENILRQIGRSNMTSAGPQESIGSSINMSSIIPTLFNSTSLEDDEITEKIRSYYPSCEIPPSLDQDLWKDDNIMNLYFNFDYGPDEKGLNVATATLRLYRIPPENSTKSSPKNPECDSLSSVEEDKLLRVSIYWYTKVMKQKRRVKRKLCDSKVVPESSRWVELSIKPAIRAWTKGRNLGLAVLVEDQEGNVLKAEKFFKGISCMVGASTPRPIPTIIIDAARQSNELDRINSLLGRNSTSPFSGDLPLLPSIDICTLEFPENYSHQPAHIANLRINACNLKLAHDQNRLTIERERLERLAALPDFLTEGQTRHIRHQRQHLKPPPPEDQEAGSGDPRSRFVNKKVLTKEELQAVKVKMNISRVDR